MDDMDPPLHANLSASGHSFTATQPGYSLLKYTTQDDIWFEVVQTVSHTNSVYFDLEARPWPIGAELVPGDPAAHALRSDGDDDYLMIGQSFLNRLNNWTLSLAFSTDQLREGTLYTETGPAGDDLLAVSLSEDGQLGVPAEQRGVPDHGCRADHPRRGDHQPVAPAGGDLRRREQPHGDPPGVPG